MDTKINNLSFNDFRLQLFYFYSTNINFSDFFPFLVYLLYCTMIYFRIYSDLSYYVLYIYHEPIFTPQISFVTGNDHNTLKGPFQTHTQYTLKQLNVTNIKNFNTSKQTKVPHHRNTTNHVADSVFFFIHQTMRRCNNQNTCIRRPFSINIPRLDTLKKTPWLYEYFTYTIEQENLNPSSENICFIYKSCCNQQKIIMIY